MNIKTDGEFRMNITGRPISIYCQNMSSSNPREYITLQNKNPLENFSEIYSRRLILPNKCPDSTSNNSLISCKSIDCIKDLNGCEKNVCLEEESGMAGLTLWNKISLNLLTMTIDRFDFRFTKQIYGKPVPFATAGDCYSISMCPRGKFSINLENTGFVLSNNVTWISEGHFPSQVVDIRKVQYMKLMV